MGQVRDVALAKYYLRCAVRRAEILNRSLSNRPRQMPLRLDVIHHDRILWYLGKAMFYAGMDGPP